MLYYWICKFFSIAEAAWKWKLPIFLLLLFPPKRVFTSKQGFAEIVEVLGVLLQLNCRHVPKDLLKKDFISVVEFWFANIFKTSVLQNTC